jgi:flap endonuclease-1
VYIFDGVPPSLKEVEVKRRLRAKEEAVKKYEEAVKRGDLEKARMYAQATARLRDYMVDDAKRFLTLMGIPWIQAPSEGEAQAAYLTMRGHAWAVGSQDYDSLLFGAIRLVRNITISGRRKLPRKPVYVKISPELIDLKDSLEKLGITRSQLVDLGILMGTDFNPDGIKGIGPKRAIALVKEYGSLEKILPVLEEVEFPVDPFEIRELFLKPKVTDNYQIRWGRVSVDGIIQFLCRERDFNEERVRKALEKAMRGVEALKLSTLETFLR